MQNSTELDLVVASLWQQPELPKLSLVIGNKNYSSWSMRPWVLMKAFGIKFDEIRIALSTPETADLIATYSLSGRVPILLIGEKQFPVWDSLAICEYLAERFTDADMWPQDQLARARARAVCAEMHSGFTGLRSAMPMDIRAARPHEGRTPEALGDVGRICELWEDCLSSFGENRYLFGDFSIADAFFAPVVMRFHTYGVSLAPAFQAYADRVRSHPAVTEWIEGALTETEFLPDSH